MVVEVFVAQRQSVNPLGDQVIDRVLDQFGVTVIGEATGESSDDPRFRFDFPQQQGPGVGRDGSAVKNSANFPLLKGLKIESICVTLCLHRVASCMRLNVLLINKLSHTRRPGAIPPGRVERWCGGLGFGITLCLGFPVCVLISVCHAPFPPPAHQTGRADFPHPAFGQGITFSPTRSCAFVCSIASGQVFGTGIRQGSVKSPDPAPCAWRTTTGEADGGHDCPPWRRLC